MANTNPVPIPESLVGFSLSTHPDPLIETLRELSSAVSKNGGILDKLYTDFTALRDEVGKQGTTLKRHMHQTELDNKRAVEEIAAIDAHVKAVAARCAWKDEVFEDLSGMSKSIQHVQTFIDEIEQGGGERVQKFIRTYMENNLPAYFKAATEPLWHRTVAAVAQAKDDGASLMEGRVKEAEERAKVLVQQTRGAVTDQLVAANDERKKDVSRLKAATEDQLQALTRRVKSNFDELHTAATELQAGTEETFSEMAHGFATLRSALFLDTRLLEGLFSQVSAELQQSAARTGQADEKAQDKKSRKETGCEQQGERDEEDEEEGQEEEEEEQEVSLDVLASDPRVVAIHRTPHFTVLRSMMQQEFQEKLDFVKGEVHSDVMAELFDVQKELKGKVGAAKLSEHIMRYRDSQLYANVRQLLADVSEVRGTKVDGAYFTDALKSKADVKSMDGKADKQQLLQTVATLTARLEHVESAQSQAASKLRVHELQHNELKVTVLKQSAVQQQRHHSVAAAAAAGAARGPGGQAAAAAAAAALMLQQPETATPQTRQVVDALDAANRLHGAGHGLPDSLVINNSLRDVPTEDELLKTHHPIGFGLKEHESPRTREYAVSQETPQVASNAVSVANNQRAELASCTASGYRRPQREEGDQEEGATAVVGEDEHHPALSIVSPARAVAVLNSVQPLHQQQQQFQQLAILPQLKAGDQQQQQQRRPHTTAGKRGAAGPVASSSAQTATRSVNSARAPRRPQAASATETRRAGANRASVASSAGKGGQSLVDGRRLLPEHDAVVQPQSVRYPHLRAHYQRQEQAAAAAAQDAAKGRGDDERPYHAFTENQRAYVQALAKNDRGAIQATSAETTDRSAGRNSPQLVDPDGGEERSGTMVYADDPVVE